MAENARRASNEMRAYYRLLRYLLREEVQDSFNEDKTEPLPPRMTNLLDALEKRESSERH